MQIHGKEYTEVKDRIKEFVNTYPHGRITTHIVWKSEDCAAILFCASVYPDYEKLEYFTTGHAYEERSKQESQVNSDAWVENCETSAIGRALANMNIGVTATRPSAEEMKKVEKNKTLQSQDDIMREIECESERLCKKALAKAETATDSELDAIKKQAKKYLDGGRIIQKHYDILIQDVDEYYTGITI